MHIITGVILSMLFSKNKAGGASPLLRLRWPIITKHILPGRVRFQIPLLKGQEEVLIKTQNQLKKIDGIHQVTITALTGSVLILFDENKLEAELLFTALIKLLGLEKELEQTPNARIKKQINQFVSALNTAVYTQTDGMLDLKTSVPLLLGLYGLFRVFTERPLSMPASVTMIWWAYNALVNQKQQG